MTHPLRITPVYDLLLRGSPDVPVGLAHLHLATADQLTRLHYRAGTLKTVKARLKTLTDAGYIQADSIPTKLFRSPYYYTMGAKGVRYLEETGMTVNASFRASKEADKHALFIEHTLEVNDLLIAAMLIGRIASQYHLGNFIHERTLKHHPYKAEWSVNGQKQTFTVIPDALLDFRMVTPDNRERRMPILLEHDRATEERQHFSRRIKAYSVFVRSEAYKQIFGVGAITIVFTTLIGTGRLKQMLDWTWQVLANELPTVQACFLFTAATQPVTPQLWVAPQWYGLQPNSAPFALLTDSSARTTHERQPTGHVTE